jgi:thiol-disulfide isomerase/thioredoxin
MQRHHLLTPFLLISLTINVLRGQTYQVGDIAEDFELTNRLTGGTSRLSDYAGQVILLEWFAHWCPFCRAAAPQVDEGIIEHYANQGGNLAGLPFIRIGLNVHGDLFPSDKVNTDNFISQYSIDPVLEDNNRVIAHRFESSNIQPIFVVINGVANSPTHAQWEIVAIRNSYLETDAPIADLKAAIDSVLAPVAEPSNTAKIVSPALTSEGQLQVLVTGNNRDQIRLRRSKDLMTWETLGIEIPLSEEAPVILPFSTLEGDYYLQAFRP